MRKVIFGVANSLDNYIAREDGSVDWLLDSDDVTAAMEEFFKRIDTVLLGRHSYEFAASQGSPTFPGVKNYVCSRTLNETPEGIEGVVPDAVAFIRDLRAQKGKDICCMSGGALAQELLTAGLIDEIYLNVHPVLLGAGVPLFPRNTQQFDLELVECRAIAHGCVSLIYRVKY